MQKCTVLVIAHRLSTIRNAHRILVVQAGAVVEEGSHTDLLTKKGIYHNLVQRQLMGATDRVEGDEGYLRYQHRTNLDPNLVFTRAAMSNDGSDRSRVKPSTSTYPVVVDSPLQHLEIDQPE